MLKDYPEHIERLQEVLTRLVAKPSHGANTFDQAIEAIENRLGVFVSEAQDQVEATKQIGAAVAIELAEDAPQARLHAIILAG
jgi:hypothetical protein